MAGMKLSIKAGLDATGVVQGAATIKAAVKSIGDEAQGTGQTYQSSARAMVEDSQVPLPTLFQATASRKGVVHLLLSSAAFPGGLFPPEK